ncbi:MULTISPECIES: riboflavin synthase [unclassified Methylophaga]|jgi:riboflavin synthase|uniref:riboflavin synthase n=1 Tax=unclassified Methylophaga TaxID=2629249 RepID=UPI000C95E94B|nr:MULTISPECIES: riboflavin synthase [unclassified Methylophaga]MAK66599.1 riboflavin synthase [Methylophaga sp.]MAY17523.1 riboflavin synthase [Methylophaga sp.]MBN47465.1 riboflavin synthase [Methylophaga sp.]HAO23669.1 riboflavin synthase [Methylophaga sp.]|tara:strand:+ start:13412 stop:14053 length:642 start_codon:yes stop_codon:yes gene_type:complete
MFTGIIAAVGQLKSLQSVGGDIRLHIDTAKLDLNDVKLGDSIAVNGVCLTVVEMAAKSLQFDVSQETLQRTSLGQLKTGSEANLEKALAVGDRLGGHMVSGHVDGLGEVISKTASARSWQYKIKVPAELERYIAEKGSITIDGVSLTVNGVFEGGFDINIIPHTLEETIIKHYQTGTKVNLEVDLIARYLERLLPQADSTISRDFLTQHGYIR